MLPRAWLQYDIFPHLVTASLAALGAISKGSLALFAEDPDATVSQALQLFRAAVADQARAHVHARLQDEGLLELDNTLSRLASTGTGDRRACVSGSFILHATGVVDFTPGDIDLYVEEAASDFRSFAPAGLAARKIYLVLKAMGYEKDYNNSSSFGPTISIDGHYEYQHFLREVVSVQKYYKEGAISIDVILVTPGTSCVYDMIVSACLGVDS
jgi:hypothetical protein